MELFPLFLKLEGRACLVVGAGRVAESKIESLIRSGAKVRVVAPQATESVREAARSGAIVWEQRGYQPSDLAGVFLVVAATSSPELHAEIFEQARREGVLCNAVDEPDRCDFYYPAVVRRGPLQIAISTGGLFPLWPRGCARTWSCNSAPNTALGSRKSLAHARNCSPQTSTPPSATNVCGNFRV